MTIDYNCDPDVGVTLKTLGKAGLTRQDGWEKASGTAMYNMDIQLPGMLYARILSCPYPHAKIKSIDASQTKAMPGVRLVADYTSAHPVIKSQCPQEGFFSGEMMGAVVVADSEEIAEEGLVS